MEWAHKTWETATQTGICWLERPLPGGGGAGAGDVGRTDVLNLFLIVGLALVITVLARYLAGRAGRRK